jgi:hypothetical protein
MKKTPSNVVATAHHSIGGGRATHKPARERAGGTATSPEDQWTLDTGPWNAVPGATGYKVRVPSGDEGDFDGRSDAERLVE